MHHSIKTFETEVRKKLTAAVIGQPEDAIRGPAETLLRDLAASLGAPAITVVPETPNPSLAVRPDMAVLRGALIGHVELKALGKGADPRRFPKGHDRDQWEKLKALPNLIYFDGEGSHSGDRASWRTASSGSATWARAASQYPLA